MCRKFLFVLLLAALPCFAEAASQRVTVSNNRLEIDGVPQPQLFGAEVQYFRLRGGYGPNQSREKVIELWNRALDKVVEAKMNAVSFYIPWDFHEYAEGKFDFTGTADEDGDGRPDYPSRDVITFLRLVKEHGIQHVLVRPGPYINAEWGFLGFGAVPEWFHDKYPDTHMQNASGLRTRLYDYHNPIFLAKTRAWFTALYNQVLKDNIGPGKPIVFVQVDNETNFLWQSIYNHDYSPDAVAAYRDFLKNRYGSLSALNSAHNRNWTGWSAVQPPKVYGQNLGEDQDWYRFHDESIHSYLGKIRGIWEDLGVKEPNVLFTLAESYNAAENGLIPNYLFRNDRGHTGLMTVNLYPKTFGENTPPLLNNPFKADLDVKAATAANAAYWGRPEEWAMGPEIQGGWWRGTDISAKARQQTYLTVIGHGLKSFFVYYFNEGDNFGAHWAHDQAFPLYTSLRQQRNIPESVSPDGLPDSFWNDLQSRMDRSLTAGFDARNSILGDSPQLEQLYFDAPLDGSAQPRDHYYELQKIGSRVIAPYQDFLASSLEVQDDVALVKDAAAHVPGDSGINNVFAASDWTSGLLGLLLNAGVNPHLAIGEISRDSTFQQKFLVHIDTGVNAPRTLQEIKRAWENGATVLNILDDSVARSLGFAPVKTAGGGQAGEGGRVPLTFYLDGKGRITSSPAAGGKSVQMAGAVYPFFHFDLKSLPAKNCEPILYTQARDVAGYRCRNERGGTLIQIGVLLSDDFGTSAYGSIPDAAERKIFLQALLHDAGVKPSLALSAQASQTVAFARHDPENRRLWITVKTGSSEGQPLRLRINPAVLPSASGPVQFRIKNLLSNQLEQTINAVTLAKYGFPFSLEGLDSTVFLVEPAR
jgi:Beta-galactosidase